MPTETRLRTGKKRGERKVSRVATRETGRTDLQKLIVQPSLPFELLVRSLECLRVFGLLDFDGSLSVLEGGVAVNETIDERNQQRYFLRERSTRISPQTKPELEPRLDLVCVEITIVDEVTFREGCVGLVDEFVDDSVRGPIFETRSEGERELRRCDARRSERVLEIDRDGQDQLFHWERRRRKERSSRRFPVRRGRDASRRVADGEDRESLTHRVLTRVVSHQNSGHVIVVDLGRRKR